jgi:lipid A 3-O-deacylase
MATATREVGCRLRKAVLAISVVLTVNATVASAAEFSFDMLAPSAAFVQLGVAEHTDALVVGAAWDSPWRMDRAWGAVTGYWEASFGRWSSRSADGVHSTAWVTQFGITPVWRLQPRRWQQGWFVEAGIGANVVTPLYRSRDKRFSTKFNFGDHVAVGRQFGVGRQHEIALRFQHFSNAGIERPNPGENFVQLRYLRHF